MAPDLDASSHFIHVPPDSSGQGGHALHLKRIRSTESAAAVAGQTRPVCFMLHGAIENGQIFYSKKGQGLAPFLARQGFDVFVGDLRGRGQSTPSVRQDRAAWPGRGHLAHGQFEVIRETIPQMLQAVLSITGCQDAGTGEGDETGSLRSRRRMSWVAHSWGGVMLTSALAFRPELSRLVSGLVCLGSKRRILTRNWEFYTHIVGFWRMGSPLFGKLFGYLPSGDWGAGSDNETTLSVQECDTWVGGPWVDPRDGFDYAASYAAAVADGRLVVPPTWHLSGVGDRYLGHPLDVRLWAAETQQTHRLTILSRGSDRMVDEVREPVRPDAVAPACADGAGAAARDYGHVDILTHAGCADDHFPAIARWLWAHSQDTEGGGVMP